MLTWYIFTRSFGSLFEKGKVYFIVGFTVGIGISQSFHGLIRRGCALTSSRAVLAKAIASLSLL